MADRGTSVVRFLFRVEYLWWTLPSVRLQFFLQVKNPPVCPWMSREKELFYGREKNAASSKISPANITGEPLSKSSFLFIDKSI